LRAPLLTEIYTLSLHDALPIWPDRLIRLHIAPLFDPRTPQRRQAPLEVVAVVRIGVRPAGVVHPQRGILFVAVAAGGGRKPDLRSEEHTSELQSRENLVCRLLL